jgi:hypothetical protein
MESEGKVDDFRGAFWCPPPGNANQISLPRPDLEKILNGEWSADLEDYKAAAEAHRRSVMQETIATLERGLAVSSQNRIHTLPSPLVPQRPVTMEETLGYIREGRP